jgi:hypothetical protein
MQSVVPRRYAFIFGKQKLHGEYQGVFVADRWLTRQGTRPKQNVGRRPLLLIGGTNITLNDQCEWIGHLLASGMEVAAIDYPIGHLLSRAIRPKPFRKSALCDFISRLKADQNVKGLDIVAHSYAAFEVVRILMADPGAYRPLVKSVVLINPPGFKRKIGAVTHCFRFMFGYVCIGWVKMLCQMAGFGSGPIEAEDPRRSIYVRRQVRGIAAMACTALKNPLRSYREVRDIVSFNIVPAMAILSKRYGYDLNIFLNADDIIVPYKDTLKAVAKFLPEENIMVVRGGHNDLIFQDWQRAVFTSFIRKIRSRQL